MPIPVAKIYRAKTPEELAIADANGHLPIPDRGINYHEIRYVWLYGKDGVLPMTDQQLQQMTGATHAQIRKNFARLRREREELMRETLIHERKSLAKTMVDEDTIAEHSRMVDLLKDQMDEVEFELQASVVGSRTHAAMLKMYLDLKDRWEKDTGMDSVKAAAAAVIKEAELEMARENRELAKAPSDKSDTAKKLAKSNVFDV